MAKSKLREHKDVGDDMAAACVRVVMAAGGGIGIRAGNPVPASRKGERGGLVRKPSMFYWGRPAPSWIVQLAWDSFLPNSTSLGIEMSNSSPS